jgi:molybdenum cofactor synthesis domain-containing protein
VSDKTITACLLVIGNEILSGRTKDANLPWLAEQLNAIGVRLMEARVIPDVEEVIVRTVNEVRHSFDYVFTTGGIGPTHDDITAECVAKAFGVPLIQHPEALKLLKAHYTNPADLNPMRLRMANVPEGATLIENPMSRAPGFQIENVYVMAGVPKIMQSMFDGLKHRLKGGAPMLSRTVRVELPEGVMAEGLAALQGRYGDIEIGSYPSFRLGGKPATAIVLRGIDASRLAGAVDELKNLMRSLGGEPIDETMAAAQ